MSKWDEARTPLESRKIDRSIASAEFNYTILYPSDQNRLWRMLCFTERDIWSFADFHDFTRFVEDFVLCENIGIPSDLFHKLGPYFFRECPKVSEFPLFEADEKLNQLIKEHIKITSTPYLEKEEELGDDIIDDKKTLRLTSKYKNKLLRESRKLTIQAAKLKTEEEKHDLFENYMVKLKREYADLILQNNELRIKSAQFICEDCLKYRAANKERYQFFHKMMAETCRSYGISVSPSFIGKEHYQSYSINIQIVRRIYDSLSQSHAEQLSLLENWTGTRSLDVPPILSILLNQSTNRASMAATLVALRTQFAGLRAEMKETQETIRRDLPLRERLDAIRRLESARETVLRKAVRMPTKSIIRRTWDIVKKGGLLGIVTGIADLLLEWDEERQLIGGLRHFVDLEQLAMLCKDDRKNVNRLFGEINPH